MPRGAEVIFDQTPRGEHMLVCAFALAVAIAVAPLGQAGAAEICVVLAPQAAPAERSAAEELAGYLRQIHPRDRFALGEELPPSGLAILLGSVSGNPRLKALLAEKPTEAESYVVTTARSGQLGIIAGADTRGVIYGVYALLEKLGCGFYLSCDALPRHAAKRSLSTAGNWPIGRWSATASCSTGTISSADVPPGTCRSGRPGSFSRRSRATTPSWSMPTATTRW